MEGQSFENYLSGCTRAAFDNYREVVGPVIWHFMELRAMMGVTEISIVNTTNNKCG